MRIGDVIWRQMPPNFSRPWAAVRQECPHKDLLMLSYSNGRLLLADAYGYRAQKYASNPVRKFTGQFPFIDASGSEWCDLWPRRFGAGHEGLTFGFLGTALNAASGLNPVRQNSRRASADMILSLL